MYSLCPIDRLCGNGAFGVAFLSVEHSLAAMVSLERITIPLKYGMIDEDIRYVPRSKGVTIWQVDLADGVLMRENVFALQLKDWRNDAYEKIDAIN